MNVRAVHKLALWPNSGNPLLSRPNLTWVRLPIHNSGFIGLVAPHWVRLIAGPDHRVVLPASALLGAAMVVFADAFARANKGLRADMLRVTTTRGGWLNEVWLCMDKAMQFTRCPGHQGGAPTSAALRIARGPDSAVPARRSR